MPNTDTQNQNRKGRKKRAITAVLLLPVFIAAASILFGVRAALFGAGAAEIEKLMLLWVSAAFLLGILLGVLFIFESPRVPGYWKIILLSAVFGIFPFMVIYPQLPENILITIAKPVTNPSFNNSTRLLISGGVDGFAFGAVVGLLILFIDPKNTRLNRFRLVRYFLLSILISVILIGSMVLNEMGDFWDRASNFISLGLILLLKYVVILRDKRRNQIV